MHDTLVEMLGHAAAELDRAAKVTESWTQSGHDRRMLHLKRAKTFLETVERLTEAGVR